jgi:hypothetical protein
MGVSMDGKTRFLIRASALLFCLLGIAPAAASAAVIELSGMVALSSSNLGEGYTTKQRRYTGSIDFKFTPVSAIEFEYTDSLTENTFPTDLDGRLAANTRENTSYKDIIFSVNWVQNLVSSKWILQPYVVIGGGRLQRKYTMSLPEFGFEQKLTQNVTTGTGGLGLRIFLTRSMALKSEIKTYVPNFQFGKWKDNQMLSIGLSWAF